MAAERVGGLSGAFIPVSEDANMITAAANGQISLEKLEAMTAVCSVGLDMVAVPGDTPDAAISGMIADEAAIGMINNKTTAVRVIPVPVSKSVIKSNLAACLELPRLWRLMMGMPVNLLIAAVASRHQSIALRINPLL